MTNDIDLYVTLCLTRNEILRLFVESRGHCMWAFVKLHNSDRESLILYVKTSHIYAPDTLGFMQVVVQKRRETGGESEVCVN